MSRNGYRDTTSKLTRSNSHDSISLNPISKFVHSTPTSHGADQRTFGAKDDSSSHEYIVSSPYENASSAIAGVVRGHVPDRQYISITSIPDQQPTVCHTKDLSLPIEFLPGEVDVKLKEDVVYRGYNRKVLYPGELIVTKYRLLFVTKPPDLLQILVNVPIGMISQMDKVGGQTRSKSSGTSYGIEIICKDLQHFFFGSSKEQHQRRNLLDHLTRLIFPFTICEIDITNPQKFFSTFFAWNYKKEVCPNRIDEGWTLYNKIEDYVRMGIRENDDPYWTINTEINRSYALCDTYPDTLVLPAKFDVSRLANVAAFRSRNRIPVLSWFCRETGVTITRASQPLTGLNRKSQDDMDYLRQISETNETSISKFFILDARPRVNALANRPNGGGYENYPDCELEFQNIQNIHVMRESLHRLYSILRPGHLDEKISTELDNANWLTHIRSILTTVNRLVSLVHYDKRSVLVHCSDGWDRTAQLTSLAMLMLDPFYRTLNGFLILIEKEWISFGHKFFLRIGHGDKNHSERSPIFLQFLDCTYQFLQQFESAFEFNEILLLTLADFLYTCQYGTFLLNSEKNRTDMNISKYTMSAWTPILRNRKSFLNPSFDEKIQQIIPQINTSTSQMKFWKNYYCRHIPDYQSTATTLTHRTATLVNLQNKFQTELTVNRLDERSSQIQSHPTSFILSGTQTTV